MNNDQHTNYTRIIEQVLSGAGRLDLNEHVNRMGPGEWMKDSTKIRNVNPLLGEAFKSMANFLKKAEDSHEDLHHAPHMDALSHPQIISILPSGHCHSTNSSDNHCLPDL